MDKILYINSCVRENSRTKDLADYLVSKLSGVVEQIDLQDEDALYLNSSKLIEREHLIQNNDLSNPLFKFANQFASADIIVIAAPFWDLSFPALLKCYIEHINVCGITFTYDNGKPLGLCNAKKLYYVTTAGGQIFDESFGFGYIKSLSSLFYNIPEVVSIKAENLDIIGANCLQIMDNAKKDIDYLFS